MTIAVDPRSALDSLEVRRGRSPEADSHINSWCKTALSQSVDLQRGYITVERIVKTLITSSHSSSISLDYQDDDSYDRTHC